ncbi:hypothetical protein JX265_011721 [Neoarthrinium moseri]|uniref:DUF6594 domain-containing protein n=1 Tax=Neoarthrinium moseri TaxID=1658444 RepID=A0A9P9WBQ0_9PEZI|nr:hypothetical protein JX266_005945 [Neoarthrinium moseri]KAI1856209.1 hypothetical protein JX265_011721 [Neoarthrinium moseri]
MNNGSLPSVDSTAGQFRQLWPRITDDSNLTLHGFRRYKTTHLLNLRFLEEEIAKLDHSIYQAGLSLGHEPSARDRLGLKNSKTDSNVPDVRETITREMVLQLRSLIQQYDDALLAFGQIMAMETVSLLDDEKTSSMRTDLTLHEMYKTRLIRADLGTRSRTDPFQRWIHQQLRDFRYWRASKKQNSPGSFMSLPKDHWSQQNTVLVANIAGRFITAIVAGVSLVVPLAILSASSSKVTQLAVVSACIVIFSLLVAAMLKVSNYEMMVVTAAYAAILSVFVSNN